MFSGKIFRSRWSALFWAAGIIWTAYDVADASAPPAKPAMHHADPSTQSGSTTGSDVSDQDLSILAHFAGNQ